jgi:hypothetical protein
MAKLAAVITWPLRKILAYSLEFPTLLEFGTRVVSHFPWLFNRLVAFAQAHGIVMSAEESGPEADEIQSVAELSPEAHAIFKSLKYAYSNQSEHKR